MTGPNADSPERLRFPREGELDAVTSLPPRKSLDEDLPRLLGLLGRERLPLCAIMIDIDHFKSFNDRWGHAVGDMVLFHVARLVREGVKYRGEAYRYGGEEITILLPNSSRSEGLATAERLVRTVAASPLRLSVDDPSLPEGTRPTDGGEVELGVQISAGVCSTAEVSGAELIVLADRALYEAKDSGRNRAVEFSPRLVSELRRQTINVRFWGQSAVSEKSNVILKAWFPIIDATEIEARDILVVDTRSREMVGKAVPDGGLITGEVPGRVLSVEKRGDYTFFELDVPTGVFDVMFEQVQSFRKRD